MNPKSYGKAIPAGSTLPKMNVPSFSSYLNLLRLPLSVSITAGNDSSPGLLCNRSRIGAAALQNFRADAGPFFNALRVFIGLHPFPRVFDRSRVDAATDMPSCRGAPLLRHS